MTSSPSRERARAWIRVLVALTAATCLWLPSLRLVFGGMAGAQARVRTRRALLHQHMFLRGAPSDHDRAIDRMRRANAEWDFMTNTFVVLALANRALERPGEARGLLLAIDRTIEDTVHLEREEGQAYFLMPYVHRAPFVDPSGRSVFVDGEIALMLAARQRVQPSERWRAPLAERIAAIAAQMERGPVRSAESYPDECWTFCNTVALAALRASGSEHDALIADWIATARERLVDRRTGLLVSSYRHDGTHLDGPEGSSIFFAAHMLSLVDPEFARDQYTTARRELGAQALGFGWAREWPRSATATPDIDSGPIVPIVEANAGASGMAILGAAAFDDEEWLGALERSLAFAAFPVHEDEERLRFAASNPVGDAVLLYAWSEGPLWRAIRSDRAAVARGQ